MSAQELVIGVNGVSRDTILNLVETHGNVTYCYLDDNDNEINVSITHYTEPEDNYEVEIDAGAGGSMMVHPNLSSAIDWFFELVEQNPSKKDDEPEDEDSDDVG